MSTSTKQRVMAAVAVLLGFANAAPLKAQGTNAQITGHVTDATGASVAGVKLVVRNVSTQRTSETVSNADGLYTVPQLDPGNYEISATKEGFKSFVRTGVTLVVDQIAQVDIDLVLGAVNQKVEVTAEASQLATSNATAGEVIGQEQIQGLPLNGRSPFRLVLLTPGIHSVPSTSGQFGDIPVNTTDDTLISIDGGPASANEVMIDGIPTTTGFINQLTTIPSVDATQEFDVQSGPLKAEWGRSGGGVINVYTKSGTNDLHGDLYEYVRNTILDADDYFDKKAGVPAPPFKMNQFGFTAGGPVYFPKLYNGRNRNFFFVDYQGTRWRQGQTYIATVPTQAQRNGDFSQSYDSQGRVIQIYNPFSTVLNPKVPGQYIRTQFPGDMISSNYINPISAKALSYVPLPNLAGNPITNTNNFISNANRAINEAEFGLKFDQSVGNREKLFERFSFNRNTIGQPNTFGNVGSPGAGALGLLNLNNYSAGVNSTTTLSPSTVLTVSYGFARFFWARPTLGFGFNQTTLGFPTSLVASEAYPLFPSFNIAGFSGIGGGNSLLFTGQSTHALLASLIKVTGRHTLQAGVDMRLNLFNQVQGGDANGTYNFAQGLTAGPNPNVFGTNSGNAFASFLLGTPSSGSMGIPAGFSLKGLYFAGYIQDDYHVNSKLTLNYGVRYAATSPMTERRNQLNWFNPTLASPAANSQFPNLQGGLVFASPSDRTVYNWVTNMWQPRFGFAYNPFTHTVVRGGAGFLYMPLSLNPTGDGIGQTPNQGFSADTPMVATLNGVIPFRTLSNPFPAGLNQPTGNSLGAATFLGQGLNVWERNVSQPSVWQWNFGLQEEVKAVLVDVLYEGSKGTHLVGPLQQNALPPQDYALGTALQQLVPNPFYGTIQTGALAQPTVTRQQLLLPYPQFTSITVLDDTYGNSIYNALAAKVRLPTRHGFTALLAYTFSKEIADVPNSLTTYNNGVNSALNTSIQNPYNLRGERSLVELDTPNSLSANFVLNLPFGKDQRFLSTSSGLLNRLVGGWQVNGILQYRSGYPLVFSAPIVDGGNRPNKVCAGDLPSGRSQTQQVQEWFDTSCFMVPAAFTFGNESRTDPHLRGPSFGQFDLGLEKHDRIKATDLMLRAEAFNLLNTVHFFQPDTNAGSLTFGQILSTTGTPRLVQLAMKLSF
ncbi:MAG: carboxypeptidase regulatory-like domain-containing protein [Acidobacteriaceae bacterium]|nr:carboxypeptidase regulatory-like domain-containing protein [Acidobacteriaceae bacterium]